MSKKILKNLKSSPANSSKILYKASLINKFYNEFTEGIHEVKLDLAGKIELKDAKTWLNEI
jgi:hypothetical protein